MKRVTIWTIAPLAAGVLLTAASLRDLPANPPMESEPVVEASRQLAGAVLYQSEDLALPTTLEVVGDRLVLSDDFADRSLRVLRRSDGALERTFGRKGRGPREFETAFAIDVIDPSGEIMVHDPTLQRVTRIDLDEDFDGDRWVADRSVSLQANAMVLVAAWKPDGLVGVGSFTDGRLVHLSAAGRQLRTTGATPVQPMEVSREAWNRAYQARLKPDPGRTRWAVASRFADRLDIYDENGTLHATADRLYGFEPGDLEEEDPAAVRFAYIDVATTGTRIYALFSGRTRAEGEANLADVVHVFDWEGRLRDVWQLEERLIALAVSPDGGRLYGVRHAPLPAVVEYALE